MKDIGEEFIESAFELKKELLEKDNVSESEERFLLALDKFGEMLNKHLPSKMYK